MVIPVLESVEKQESKVILLNMVIPDKMMLTYPGKKDWK